MQPLGLEIRPLGPEIRHLELEAQHLEPVMAAVIAEASDQETAHLAQETQPSELETLLRSVRPAIRALLLLVQRSRYLRAQPLIPLKAPPTRVRLLQPPTQVHPLAHQITRPLASQTQLLVHPSHHNHRYLVKLVSHHNHRRLASQVSHLLLASPASHLRLASRRLHKRRTSPLPKAHRLDKPKPPVLLDRPHPHLHQCLGNLKPNLLSVKLKAVLGSLRSLHHSGPSRLSKLPNQLPSPFLNLPLSPLQPSLLALPVASLARTRSQPQQASLVNPPPHQ